MRTNDPPAGFAACDKCEGTGMGNNGPETSGIGRPDWFEEWPCPSCQGSGLVPTDELREKATDTLLHVLYPGSDRSQLGSTQVRMHERARRKAQQ